MSSPASSRHLTPATAPATTWPGVRTYLDGIAETLDLPDPDVLTDHGCRWWLQNADRRPTRGERRLQPRGGTGGTRGRPSVAPDMACP